MVARPSVVFVTEERTPGSGSAVLSCVLGSALLLLLPTRAVCRSEMKTLLPMNMLKGFEPTRVMNENTTTTPEINASTG